MTLAEILEAERNRQGVSINAVADAGGITYSAAWYVLSGKVENPRIHTLRAVLRGLGKRLAWLERKLEEAEA